MSETSSQSVFSPTEGEGGSHDEDETDDSVSETEYADAEMLAPYKLEASDDSSSLYSNRLSIVTAKRSSAATCVPHGQDEDATLDENEEGVTPDTEYLTPPASPFYLSPVCYVPESSQLSRTKSILSSEDDDEDEPRELEKNEVLEAKQVVFTTPVSRPSIVMIQSPTTESILAARMGDPIRQSKEQNSLDRPALNIRKRSSTKRSSSASGMTTPEDRSKRYSAMFFRDFTQDGEIAYFDARSHVRARSSQSPGRSISRPRAESPMTGSVARGSSNSRETSESRQARPQRNPSQRSSSRSSRYTSDHEAPRNYSRPRSIRSSSVASDMTTASSASWKRVHTHNWSSTSLQYSSSSSVEQSSQPGESETPKAIPHPLSIITTPTSPITSSHDAAAYTRLTPQPQPQSHSAVSPFSEIDWSPVERTNTSSMVKPKTFPYTRPRNPSLSLSIATAAEDLDPTSSTKNRDQNRRESTYTSSPIFGRKSSISTPTSASTKQSLYSAGTVKSIINGFRGRGKQRTRE